MTIPTLSVQSAPQTLQADNTTRRSRKGAAELAEPGPDFTTLPTPGDVPTQTLGPGVSGTPTAAGSDTLGKPVPPAAGGDIYTHQPTPSDGGTLAPPNTEAPRTLYTNLPTPAMPDSALDLIGDPYAPVGPNPYTSLPQPELTYTSLPQPDDSSIGAPEPAAPNTRAPQPFILSAQPPIDNYTSLPTPDAPASPAGGSDAYTSLPTPAATSPEDRLALASLAYAGARFATEALLAPTGTLFSDKS